MKTNIHPLEGYILTKPYIRKGLLGTNLLNEPQGEDQISEVLEVGGPTIDNNGTTRFTSVKKGNLIIHAQSNKDFTIDTQLYRFVHFVEVHGIYTPEEDK